MAKRYYVSSFLRRLRFEPIKFAKSTFGDSPTAWQLKGIIVSRETHNGKNTLVVTSHLGNKYFEITGDNKETNIQEFEKHVTQLLF